MADHTEILTASKVMTAGELRSVLHDVADDVPIHVGIWGLKHFNEVLGTMPVTAVRKNAGAVLLYVQSLS
jgi:hypothetical protein